LNRRLGGPHSWSGQLCISEKSLAPAQIQTPNNPAHSLYQLRYPTFQPAHTLWFTWCWRLKLWLAHHFQHFRGKWSLHLHGEDQQSTTVPKM
jgi:hypothetical protein